MTNETFLKAQELHCALNQFRADIETVWTPLTRDTFSQGLGLQAHVPQKLVDEVRNLFMEDIRSRIAILEAKLAAL